MKKTLATVFAVALGLGAWAVDPVTIKDADGADISVYEVSSGFYQNGDTYDSTTDFYITSKDGLKYFRDWVNGTSAAMNHYYDSGFLTLSLASFASNNGMAGKNVHLLADIDLTGKSGSPSAPIPDPCPTSLPATGRRTFTVVSTGITMLSAIWTHRRATREISILVGLKASLDLLHQVVQLTA